MFLNRTPFFSWRVCASPKGAAAVAGSIRERHSIRMEDDEAFTHYSQCLSGRCPGTWRWGRHITNVWCGSTGDWFGNQANPTAAPSYEAHPTAHGHSRVHGIVPTRRQTCRLNAFYSTSSTSTSTSTSPRWLVWWWDVFYRDCKPVHTCHVPPCRGRTAAWPCSRHTRYTCPFRCVTACVSCSAERVSVSSCWLCCRIMCAVACSCSSPHV